MKIKYNFWLYQKIGHGFIKMLKYQLFIKWPILKNKRINIKVELLLFIFILRNIKILNAWHLFIFVFYIYYIVQKNVVLHF